MLVLTREAGERIVIDGGRIVIEVLSAGKVRLGVTAPIHVSVDREEVHQAKQRRRGWRQRPAA